MFASTAIIIYGALIVALLATLLTAHPRNDR